LRVHGSLAKADIARLTGLTAQTIGLITARLDEDQLLRREAPVRGRVGQPSVPLGLHPDGAFAIGIKIGRRSESTLVVADGLKSGEVIAMANPEAKPGTKQKSEDKGGSSSPMNALPGGKS
jgi:hypothetical protein